MPDGRPADAQDVAALDRAPAARSSNAARAGLMLAADQVFVLAHWITDRDLPRRFDVPFLVARMPEGQSPVADETEQFEPVWVRPADALARHAAGSFFMIFPTIRTLERLAQIRLGAKRCCRPAPASSRCGPAARAAGLLKGAEARYMEHEMPYGELALVSPDGQIVHHLDWRSDAAGAVAQERDAADGAQPAAR